MCLSGLLVAKGPGRFVEATLQPPRQPVVPSLPSCTAALEKPSQVTMQHGKYKLSDVWGTPLTVGSY